MNIHSLTRNDDGTYILTYIEQINKCKFEPKPDKEGNNIPICIPITEKKHIIKNFKNMTEVNAFLNNNDH